MDGVGACGPWREPIRGRQIGGITGLSPGRSPISGHRVAGERRGRRSCRSMCALTCGRGAPSIRCSIRGTVMPIPGGICFCRSCIIPVTPKAQKHSRPSISGVKARTGSPPGSFCCRSFIPAGIRGDTSWSPCWAARSKTKRARDGRRFRCWPGESAKRMEPACFYLCRGPADPSAMAVTGP